MREGGRDIGFLARVTRMPRQQEDAAKPPASQSGASLSAFFAPGGLIAQTIRGFEPRQQQSEMASAVQKSLSEAKHLVVEAGTGVGKSLGYLVPSALWATRTKQKVLVATYTKALQEQLTKKDLPLVKTALQMAGLPFQYFLLMGSANYICLRRLQIRLDQSPKLIDDGSRAVLDTLEDWAKMAESGLRSEAPVRVAQQLWEDVCRDPDLCLRKRCGLRDACLYRKDVARAKEADLVVINQHLFFSGLPLSAFGAVVFDEAHNLEDVASHSLGFSLTSRQIKRLLDDILNLKSGRGLAQRLKVQPPEWIPRIRATTSDAHLAANSFFEDIRRRLGLEDSQAPHPRAKRVREPNIVKDPLSEPLKSLIALLGEAVGLSQKAEEEVEIKAVRNRCLKVLEQLNAFLQCKSKEHAYWAEFVQSKRGSMTSLNTAPLDVSKALKKDLFEKISPVILTSATLAVDGSFAMVKSRLGLDESIEVLLDSPFEYQRQAVIYNAPNVPDPKDADAYEKAVLEQSIHVAAAVTGGIFALYTSWKLLEKASKVLTAEATKRPVFKQGDGATHQLLSEFKKAGNGILLATDTFWQGIDVPGPALSCVMITRLPFVSPDSPLEEARHEWMAGRGINAFNEYELPRAVIKFRQGFGRLIRCATDFGAVVVLDPRVRTRRYGAVFLRSVPKCRQVSSVEEMKKFFESGGSARADA